MKKKTFITIFFFGVLLTPFVSFAQTAANTTCPNGGTLNANGSCNLGYTPLEPIPGLTSGFDVTNPANFGKLINSLFIALFTIGALFAVVMLTVGGIQYMLTDVVVKKANSLHRAQSALLGMLILAGSWLILYTVNPQLLVFNLNPCPAGSTGCTIAPAPVTTSSAQASPADSTEGQAIANALNNTPPTQQGCSDMYNAYYNPISFDGLSQGASMIYVAVKDGFVAWGNTFSSTWDTTAAAQAQSGITSSSFNAMGQANLNYLQSCQSAGYLTNQ